MPSDKSPMEDRGALPEIDWRIARTGHRWTTEEYKARRGLGPHKIEMIEGKLFWSERDRLIMLAFLLENVGVDQTVRIGDPKVWREAIRELDKQA